MLKSVGKFNLSSYLVLVLVLVLCHVSYAKLSLLTKIVEAPSHMEKGKSYRIKVEFHNRGDELPEDYLSYLDFSFQGNVKVKLISSSGWETVDIHPPGSTIWAPKDKQEKEWHQIQSSAYLVSGYSFSTIKKEKKYIIVEITPLERGNVDILYRGTITPRPGSESEGNKSIRYPQKGTKDQQNLHCEVISITVE